jgi:hypothetical protein
LLIITLILLLPVIASAFCWTILLYSLTGRNILDSKRWIEERVTFVAMSSGLPLVAFSYLSTFVGSALLGLYLAVTISYVSFVFAVGGLRLVDGVLGLFGEHKSKASPAAILGCSLIFATAFGAIHYAVWAVWHWEYKNITGWQDALYFSVTTMATVGYGDIYPVGHLAKWLCVMEIMAGFTLLVVAVNASMAVWLQIHQPREANPNLVQDSGLEPSVREDGAGGDV